MDQTEQSQIVRIGFGYDVHRLKAGRKLILGGEQIPFEMGLDGHSDADVLIHAVIDALLGAMAKGDIGGHFPDTDPAYKDADSRNLLRSTLRLVNENGYLVGNIDATIVAQKPKLAEHVTNMRENIASDLNVSVSSVSVKATTSEGIGMIGRGEGISAMAVCILTGTAPDN